jgi:hypothetical protein
MKYFTREASQQLSNWKGKSRWDSLWARYRQELARIRDELTPGWREVADNNFHDAIILAVEQPTGSTVILRIDMGGERVCTLQFVGVREARIPESVVYDRWLYTEVHLTADSCGDLQVLLYKTELQIVASDVGVFKNYQESV